MWLIFLGQQPKIINAKPKLNTKIMEENPAFKICKQIRVMFYVVTLKFTSVKKLGMIIGWLLWPI